MNQTTLLITGGSGYLASAFRHRLVGMPDIRWLTMTRSSSLQPLCERETVVIGDVWSTRSAPERLDVTLHLAGLVGDAACQEQPILAERLNVDGTKRALELSHNAGARRFIFVSTSSIYDDGSHDSSPMSEDTAANPKAIYGQTKLRAEALLMQHQTASSAIIMRFPAIIGWSPTMRYDTFANKFFLGALRTGQISILANRNYDVWRPILTLEHALQALLSAITSVSVQPGIYNVISENQPVREFAERIRSFFELHDRAVSISPNFLPKPSSYSVVSAQPMVLMKNPEKGFAQEVANLWDKNK